MLWVLQFKKGIFHVTGHVHYAVLFLPRNKTILTIHDLSFLYNKRGVKHYVLKKLFLDWPIKKLNILIAISEKTKQEIIAYTKCDPNKIIKIANPVSEDIQYVPKSFNQELPTLLFIGTKPNKNLSRTIEAVKGLSVHLHIVGRLNESILAALQENNISYTNQFDLSAEELVQAYQQCDIVMFPSLYEGFGLPLLEGFKAGRPVITSNIEPMKTLAENAAILINPLDISSIRQGIITLCSNPELRMSNVESGLMIVKKYAPTEIVKQYEKVWRQLGAYI